MTLVKTKSALPSFFPSFWNDILEDDFNAVNRNMPAVNIKETEASFELEFAVPGVGKKDFEINVDHDLLIVEAKKDEKNKRDDGQYTVREFNATSFKRTFTLPESVNMEKIRATYENGILRVSLEKKEEAKPQPKRMIEVK